MSNKVTSKDALNAVKVFADVINAVKAFSGLSEKNITFGVLADIEHGNIATHIKGEESEILALIVMQMAKDDDFKKLLYKAVTIHKTSSIQKIINEYENKH